MGSAGQGPLLCEWSCWCGGWQRGLSGGLRSDQVWGGWCGLTHLGRPADWGKKEVEHWDCWLVGDHTIALGFWTLHSGRHLGKYSLRQICEVPYHPWIVRTTLKGGKLLDLRGIIVVEGRVRVRMLRKGGDALHYTSAHFISITIKANYVLPIFIDGEMETLRIQ